MTDDALIEEINGAYRRLSAATEALARATARRARPGSVWTTPRRSWRRKTRGRRAFNSTACSTPTSTAAWMPPGRWQSLTTSTRGARWTGCSRSFGC